MEPDDLPAAALEVVAEACVNAMGPRPRTVRSTMRRGVRSILSRVATEPGLTWQQKWVAAGDANEAYFRDQFDYSTPNDPEMEATRKYLPQAFKMLLHLSVIRPGLLLTLHPGAANAILGGVVDDNQRDIDRLIAAVGSNTQLAGNTAIRVRNAAAAMVVFTGKRLPDITVDEWVAAETQRRSASTAHRDWQNAVANTPDGAPLPVKPVHAVPYREMLSLSSAYSGARISGLITARAEEPGRNPLPPTLDGALKPAVNLDNLLAHQGADLPPHVRALAYDTYTLDGVSLDTSTIRHHIVDLNTYFRAIHAVLPGHDSLTIPLETRDAVYRTLSLTNPTLSNRPNEERQALGHILSRVRVFYKMANSVTRRFELTQHLSTLGSFPWSDATVRKVAKKERARRRTRLHVTVMSHLPHLDGLVEASHDLVARTDRILAAARAAEPGGTFTVDEVVFLRAKGTGRPHTGSGVTTLSIRRADRGPMTWYDIEKRAYRTVQARALLVLLRETGLRIEEVAELTVENVDVMLSGETQIPTVNVNPSKMDRARVVGLTPAALTALHDVIARSRERFGTSPLVTRADWHEGTDQAPARLIFFVLSRRTFVGPERSVFAALLSEVVEHYNANFNPTVALPKVTPHQLRRLFASDLAERGADVLAIQQTLGHATLSTTGIYVHIDEAQALAEIVEARRRARARAEGNQCPCCQGTGYHRDPNHNPNHPVDEPD